MNQDLADLVEDMRKHPGAFFMLICECTHKESGHLRYGHCERCDCFAFRNTTHISIGDQDIC